MTGVPCYVLLVKGQEMGRINGATTRDEMENLLANKERTIAIAGLRTWRLWRLYMAGSAYFFNKGNLGLYQILAGKNRHAWPLPLSREHLYR